MAVSAEVLAQLRRHSTPTICNAIEEFDVRPRSAGCMGPAVRCAYPDLPPMVGHAVTATISAARPGGPRRVPARAAFWESVLAVPAPRVVVMQDLDPEPAGAYWGEVQATIHLALGCVGAVTNGGARDVGEVLALGFHLFSACVLPSHAYVHLESIGEPVTVAGLEVRPGDLLHGDRHGVTSIPLEIAGRIDEAAQRVAQREQRIFAACRAEPLDIAGLSALLAAGPAPGLTAPPPPAAAPAPGRARHRGSRP